MVGKSGCLFFTIGIATLDVRLEDSSPTPCAPKRSLAAHPYDSN